MKVVEKLKKVVIGIGLFVSTISTKVFATIKQIYEIDNLTRIQPEYGVPGNGTRIIREIWHLLKVFVIPLIFIIGIIIYLKKSKSSKKRKIITVLIMFILVVALYFVGNYFVKFLIENA